MTHNLIVRAMFMTLTFTLLSIVQALAQPMGANLYNPIDAGEIQYGTYFSDTQNNDPVNDFGNEKQNNESDDIYYRFSINQASTVRVSHCNSEIDTYLYILDEYGNTIISWDDYGPVCSSMQASGEIFLDPGTYYVVSEGYSSYYGNITTEISLIPILPTEGVNMSNAIDAGLLSPGQTYSDTRSNSPVSGYQNDYGQPSDDIFYKFTINESSEVSIGHCGSAMDTYIHLLDANGSRLFFKDDNGPVCPGFQASLREVLPAGTYYVVSEGYNTSSGDIITTIQISGEEEFSRPNAFYEKISQVFQHVDRSPVTSGILLDAGAEFVNMSNYQGTAALVDSNAVTSNIWRSVYGTLMSAKINDQVGFTDFDAINSRIDGYTGANSPIPFLLLNYNYQAFREDAISLNLISINNEQLYDVPGRAQSPYITKTAFAIAPAMDEIKAPGGYAEFFFPSDLILGNTGKTMNQLKVDMGDGAGWRIVVPGTNFGVQYASSGIKGIKYEVRYTDNSVYTGHSRIYIEYENDRQAPGGASLNYYAPTTPIHRISVNTPQGTRWATLQFRLTEHPEDNSGHSNVIKKPLIVVEGMDFWRITNKRNQDIESFVNGALLPNITSTNRRLREEIDLKGYDIVYIDFDEATDYLENNSALVQAAIEWVNGSKQSLNGVKQQNVVIGLSMGGVLARHALRSMEINNTSHDTKLLVTVDSPHDGANTPLGLQAFITHLYNTDIQFMGIPLFRIRKQYPDLEKGMQALSAPGCAQLLKYRVVDQYGELKIDNSPHDTFFNNYHAMGMPSCRSVAISNGDGCGNGQSFSPHSTIFSMDKGISLMLQILAVEMKLLGYEGWEKVAELNPNVGPASFFTDCEAKALPDHQHLRIYHGRLGIRLKVFGIKANINISNRSAYSASYMLPLDNAPGGSQGFNGNGMDIPADMQQYFTITRFTYLPTVSALDVGNGATLTTSQLRQAYNYSNGNNTPFASFVTAVNRNEDHVTFTNINGQYLLKELSGNTGVPLNCSFLCSPYLGITGPDQFCGAGTFSLNTSLPAGATVSWTKNNTIISTTNTPSFTYQGGVSELINLGAIIHSPCGDDVPVQPKSVMVGNATPPPGIYNVYCGDEIWGTGRYNFYMASFPNATSYTWYYWGSSAAGREVVTTDPWASIYLDQAGSWTILVKVSTSCGDIWLDNEELTIQVPYYNSLANKNEKGLMNLEFAEEEQINNFVVYPNPASSQITVYIPVKYLSEGKNSSITLFDSSGKAIRKVENRNGSNKVVLDVKDFTDGTYFINISIGKEVIKRQVIVKH